MLISVDDLSGRTTSFDTAKTDRAEVLIADAVTKIEVFGQTAFEPKTRTEVLPVIDGKVLLQHGPVRSVTSVESFDKKKQEWSPLPGDGRWCWDGHRSIEVGVKVLVVNRDYCEFTDEQVRVTWQYGFDPGDDSPEVEAAKAVAAAMVNRVLFAPSITEGVTSEQIADYGYQMQQGQGTTGVGVKMLTADRAQLKAAGFGPASVASIRLNTRR